MSMVFDSLPNDQAMATPLAGAALIAGLMLKLDGAWKTGGLVGVAIRALFASLLSVALLTLSELLEAFPLVR